MDVTTERPEVAFVFDQFRLESSLKQVAGPLMTFGIPVGVSAQQVLHPSRQVGLGRLHKKMNMIRHPNVGQDLPSRSGDRRRQPVGHSLVVAIDMKNRLTTIPPCHDVIDRVRKFNS